MSKYKIGQLSKTMGVSTHLLKHYEKFNLVSPSKDDSTQYRYYDIGQCANIIEAKKLRNMGFAVKETSDMVRSLGMDQVQAMLVDQVKQLEEQLRIIEQQKQYAQYYLKDVQIALENVNEWFVESLKGLVFLKQTKNDLMIEDAKTNWDSYDFLEELPVAKSGIWFHKSSFEGVLDYHWGIASEEGKEISQQDLDVFFTLPEGKYFTSFVKVAAPFVGNFELVNAIKAQFAKFRNEPLNEALALKYSMSHENGVEYCWFKVIVPIV